MQMGRLLINHLLVWIPLNLMFQTSTPLVVLDHCLQSGNGMVPKWEPQAQMGLYVGRLPSHAANIALIFDPRTGHVSP
jgi:hypothetical protein